MNKKCLLLSAAFAVAITFIACGDDSSTSASDSKSQSSEVKSFDDLPKCKSKNEGDTIFVKADDASYVCEAREWVLVEDENGEDDKDLSSSSENESSSSFDKSKYDEVKTKDDLDACTTKNKGDSVYVTKEDAVYTCENKEWVEVKEESDDKDLDKKNKDDDDDDDVSSNSKDDDEKSSSSETSSSSSVTSSSSSVTSSSSSVTSSSSSVTSSSSSETSSSSSVTSSSSSVTSSSSSVTSLSSSVTSSSSTGVYLDDLIEADDINEVGKCLIMRNYEVMLVCTNSDAFYACITNESPIVCQNIGKAKYLQLNNDESAYDCSLPQSSSSDKNLNLSSSSRFIKFSSSLGPQPLSSSSHNLILSNGIDLNLSSGIIDPRP